MVRDSHPGWYEDLLGALPEMFFEVRRVVIDRDEPAGDDTAGRLHVLNVVDGHHVLVETAGGYRHSLAYAETLMVPAAAGVYYMCRLGSSRVRLVKSLVR